MKAHELMEHGDIARDAIDDGLGAAMIVIEKLQRDLRECQIKLDESEKACDLMEAKIDRLLQGARR